MFWRIRQAVFGFEFAHWWSWGWYLCRNRCRVAIFTSPTNQVWIALLQSDFSSQGCSSWYISMGWDDQILFFQVKYGADIHANVIVKEKLLLLYWEANLSIPISGGENTDPLSPSTLGRAIYLDTIEEEHPGHVRELYQYAESVITEVSRAIIPVFHLEVEFK